MTASGFAMEDWRGWGGGGGVSILAALKCMDSEPAIKGGDLRIWLSH
jgi:hypothetical protein